MRKAAKPEGGISCNGAELSARGASAKSLWALAANLDESRFRGEVPPLDANNDVAVRYRKKAGYRNVRAAKLPALDAALGVAVGPGKPPVPSGAHKVIGTTMFEARFPIAEKYTAEELMEAPFRKHLGMKVLSEERGIDVLVFRKNND